MYLILWLGDRKEFFPILPPLYFSKSERLNSLERRMMETMFTNILVWTAFLGQVVNASGVASSVGHRAAEDLGTVAFASVGRGHFAYDIFSVKIADSWLQNGDDYGQRLRETKLTDGVSVNYNGQFVEAEGNDFLFDGLKSDTVDVSDDSSLIVFVSERGGSARIYFRVPDKDDGRETIGAEVQNLQEYRIEGGKASDNQVSRNRVVTLMARLPFDGPVMYDRPIVTSGSILFVSTAEPGSGPRQSWAAIYKTDMSTGSTIRLTPSSVADFSPSVSPCNNWVAVASYGEGRYHGETDDLMTDLYAFRAEDGSSRRLLIKHGGWPSWADERTIFFHRQAEDGWWSIFRIILPENFLQNGAGSLQEERITPPGVHAITPAASRTGRWIAIATRRPTSAFRHVEIFDLIAGSFVKITEVISCTTHHYNPFVSESGSVGYHRCRGNPSGSVTVPRLQHVRSPVPGLKLIRVDGTFPSFSPDGSLLGVIWNMEDSTVGLREDEEGLYVMNASGTNQRRILQGKFFGLAWDPVRRGVLYTSFGPEFRSTKTVNIIAVQIVDGIGQSTFTPLTEMGNNALPSPSPDGRYLVFRSKRSGYKNLYIMDATHGEKKYLRRLTDGPWTDQHPAWSPTGEWIAFTSNRENPNVGTFGKCSIYLIRPDGSGLRKIIQSSDDGLAVHPQFSPDGQKLVFVSDLAGVSSEPVSGAAQFQPFGEVFMANLDGSSIRRLTHNGVEDGTASWNSRISTAADLSHDGSTLKCDAEDITWMNSLRQESSHHCAGLHISSVFLT